MSNKTRHTKILLHACCGPCSLEPVRLLEEEGFEPVIAFINPNIHPRSEYERRLATLKAWAEENNLEVIEGAYDIDEWMKQVYEQSENGTDRELRCRLCYRMRLERSAELAARHDISVVATTLSVSPYQYTDTISEELSAAAAGQGIDAKFDDYRANYPRATKKSKELGMYRQNYCGCFLSDKEAQDEREAAKAQRDRLKAEKRKAREEREAQLRPEKEAAAAKKRADQQKRAEHKKILRELREENKR